MVKQVLQQAQTGLHKLANGTLHRPFVHHVGALTVANSIDAVLSLLQGIFVARWLGPELYGIATLVMSIPSLLHTFFDARSVEVSVKYLSEFDTKGERERALAICKLGYTVDLAIAFLTFFVVLVTAGWAASRIVRRSEMAILIIIYAAAFLLKAFVGTSYAIMASLGRFLLIATIETLTTILRVGLVLGLILAGWQVAGVVWGNTIAIVVAGLLYSVCSYSLAKRQWGNSWLKGNWQYLKGRRREILGFLAYNDLSVLLNMIPKKLDIVILGYFRSPTEVGYYKLAKTISSRVGYLVGSLQSVIYPDLARLYGIGDQIGLWRKVKHLAWKVGTPLMLLILVVILCVPLILPVIFGSSFNPIIYATQILFIGYGLWLIFFWLKPLYLVCGRAKEWAIFIGIYSFISLIGWLIFVPYYGYIALCLWWLLTLMIGYIGLPLLWLFLINRR